MFPKNIFNSHGEKCLFIEISLYLFIAILPVKTARVTRALVGTLLYLLAIPSRLIIPWFSESECKCLEAYLVKDKNCG
jgi:hypothetical protein